MIRLFRVFVPTSVLALLISEAILITFCYVFAAFFTLDNDPEIFLLYENGLWRIGIVAGSIMLGVYFHDLYWQFRIKSRLVLIQQFCFVLGIAFLSQALLSYLHLPNWTLPKWLMIGGSALVLILLPSWRVVYSRFALKALGYQRLLFLGSSPIAREIALHLQEVPQLGLLPIGFVDDAPEGSSGLPASRLGSIPDLQKVVEEAKPDRIVVGMSERRQRLPVELLLDLRFSGIRIEDALTTYETAFGRVCTRVLRPSQLVFSSDLGPRQKSVQWQSFYSFLFAMAVLIPALPFMLISALLVRLTSAGPILYRQKRVGKNEKVFVVYKFRSMYKDAEARTGAVWAKKDDPRTTPVGRWLRKLRLDELPQLFNVLRGDMAIVGPRPERPEFVQTLSEAIPYYRQRLCVKPGITGWAQINHKYGDTLEDTIVKLEYDLYYIKNLGFSLDLYIMFQTVKVMLLSRGAQ